MCYGDPMRRGQALRDLKRISRGLKERPILIALARFDGATWPQIAEAADLSRAWTIRLYQQAAGDLPENGGKEENGSDA